MTPDEERQALVVDSRAPCRIVYQAWYSRRLVSGDGVWVLCCYQDFVALNRPKMPTTLYLACQAYSLPRGKNAFGDFFLERKSLAPPGQAFAFC